MPTYGYICKSCGYHFEEFQRMSDPPLCECPKCGGELQRIIYGGTGVIFKGSGWYVTDYGKGKSSATVGSKHECAAESAINKTDKNDEPAPKPETKTED